MDKFINRTKFDWGRLRLRLLKGVSKRLSMNSFAQLCWASLLVLLTSCGGGGGGSSSPAGGTPTTSAFSGVAIDGNLYLARAFLDLNGNGTYDNGEPTAITASDGTFTLTATQDQINSHSVVVSVIAGTTIDQDTPNTPLSSGFTMMSPAGSHSVVSPLTTQVAAKMNGGLTLDLAKAAIKTELGLTSIDVMKNYVAEKATNSAYADAHKVAASVAEVLKTVDSSSNTSTTLTEKLSSISTKVTSQVAPHVIQIKASVTVNDAKNFFVNVINTVVAASTFNLTGSLSGLTATGLVLSNGTDNTNLSANASSFVFKNKLANSDVYEVKIKTQPTGQICTISNGLASINNQSVTNIVVTCADSPGTLSGIITGLTTSGLILKNGTEELTVTSGSTSFQFQNKVKAGLTYLVNVNQQPTGKTCSVSSNSGAMTYLGVNDVQVTCATNSYSISGSISGLVTSGLKLKNGSEVKEISAGSSTFELSTQVAYGGSYAVTVDTQPTGYTCSLSNSSGTMSASNVTSVQVTCSTNALVAKVDSLEISIGLSTQINTSYKSADGTSNELEGSSLTYTSSNSEIVTVTKEGLVNAMGPGVASIAITYKNTETTLEITVTNGVYPIGFSGQVYN